MDFVICMSENGQINYVFFQHKFVFKIYMLRGILCQNFIFLINIVQNLKPVFRRFSRLVKQAALQRYYFLSWQTRLLIILVDLAGGQPRLVFDESQVFTCYTFTKPLLLNITLACCVTIVGRHRFHNCTGSKKRFPQYTRKLTCKCRVPHFVFSPQSWTVVAAPFRRGLHLDQPCLCS